MKDRSVFFLKHIPAEPSAHLCAALERSEMFHPNVLHESFDSADLSPPASHEEI